MRSREADIERRLPREPPSGDGRADARAEDRAAAGECAEHRADECAHPVAEFQRLSEYFLEFFHCRFSFRLFVVCVVVPPRVAGMRGTGRTGGTRRTRIVLPVSFVPPVPRSAAPPSADELHLLRHDLLGRVLHAVARTQFERDLRAGRDLRERGGPRDAHAERVARTRRDLRALRLAVGIRPRKREFVAERRVELEVPAVDDDRRAVLDDEVLRGIGVVDVVDLHRTLHRIDVRPREVVDGPLQFLEGRDGDLVAVLRAELARRVHRAGEFAVDAQPVVEVDGLAVASELLDGLDEAVQCAAHVVELSAHVAGVERVLDDLVGAQGFALGDDGAQERRAGAGIPRRDDAVLEFGLVCHVVYSFRLVCLWCFLFVFCVVECRGRGIPQDPLPPLLPRVRVGLAATCGAAELRLQLAWVATGTRRTGRTSRTRLVILVLPVVLVPHSALRRAGR